MQYIYHGVPDHQLGDMLYPLNALKEIHPTAYALEVEKYSWRKRLLKREIPVLDCLWNDVLHFTAVHPTELKAALIEAGSRPDFQMKFYQVDPAELDQKKLVVYLYQYNDEADTIDARNIQPFRIAELPELAVIPEATKAYFRDEFAKGERPLIFHGVPHVLYQGNLDTRGLPIVSA